MGQVFFLKGHHSSGVAGQPVRFWLPGAVEWSNRDHAADSPGALAAAFVPGDLEAVFAVPACMVPLRCTVTRRACVNREGW